MKHVLSFFFLVIITTVLSSENRKYTEKRLRMVSEQIAARGITDSQVLKAMRKIPRHLFVPDKYRKYAYNDYPQPIGYGQTISQPYVVALMTELLEVNEKSKVLEVGTGSGYQAAVLAEIADKVYTIEIVDGLYKRATKLFKEQKYTNIYTKAGDGYYGWEKNGPYDAIIVTCASSLVPPPLLKQLKVGGVMCIPVGPPFQVQNLLLITRKSTSNIKVKIITQVRFVPLVRKKR